MDSIAIPISLGPHRDLRIGLISPYTGSNLGDQAIHISCIEQLRSRCRTISFTAICLNPARVSSLHNVAAFPITGLAVPFYSDSPVPDRRNQSFVREIARSMKRRLRAVRNASRWLVGAWRLVGTLDAVVVAGGGQIDDEWGGAWGHPCSLFCWAFLCQLRGKPFLVLSIGFCRAESPLSRRFFRKALRIAAYISCRDEGSIAAIQNRLGNVPAQFVPDLACGLPALRHYAKCEPEKTAAEAQKAPLIVVSPIAFGRSGSWPTEADTGYRRYITELGGFSAALLANGYRLRILITSSPDEPAIDDLLGAIHGAGQPGSERLFDTVEVFRPATVDDLCALLVEAHCTVISRLHGVMLSQLLLRPVLAISFDRKVAAQMAQSGQDAYLTQIQTVTRQELSLLFENLLAFREPARERLRLWAKTSEHAVQRQFNTAVALF
jgi:polysaccharide pyruvyl transferase WcaK-like protein